MAARSFEDDRPRLTITRRAAALIALVVLLAGMALRSCISAPPGPERADRGVRHAPATGPRTSTAGMPSGYTRTRDGVLAAATTLVRQGQDLFELEGALRDAALRAVVAREAAATWIRQQHQWLEDLDRLAVHSQAPVTWHVAVLATRVEAFTRTRARVALWRVGILSTRGFVAPVATYAIVTYEFVWQAGDWKVWSETQQPGPTPVVSPNERPALPEDLDKALTGFTRFPALGA